MQTTNHSLKQLKDELRVLQRNRKKVQKDFSDYEWKLVRALESAKSKTARELTAALRRADRETDRIDRRILILEGRLSA